jgi:phage terminase small subunit
VSETSETKPLKPRQIIFARAYARTLNASLAAREAGVKPKNAATTGYRWLHKPQYAHVLAYVDELLADDAAQRKIDHDILRQRLRSRLTIDQRELWDEGGQPINPKDLPEELAQHVKSFSSSKYETRDSEGNIVQEGTNSNLHLSSDTKAMELLGRHSGFFSKETQGDQFNDYLQADLELERSLTELDEECDEEFPEEATPEEASGDS